MHLIVYLCSHKPLESILVWGVSVSVALILTRLIRIPVLWILKLHKHASKLTLFWLCLLLALIEVLLRLAKDTLVGVLIVLLMILRWVVTVICVLILTTILHSILLLRWITTVAIMVIVIVWPCSEVVIDILLLSLVIAIAITGWRMVLVIACIPLPSALLAVGISLTTLVSSCTVWLLMMFLSFVQVVVSVLVIRVVPLLSFA